MWGIVIVIVTVAAVVGIWYLAKSKDGWDEDDLDF